MKVSLEVTIPVRGKVLKLKNPIMPAAGTFGNVIEYSAYVEPRKLGALIPASVCCDAGSPPPAKRAYLTEHGVISSFGPGVIGLGDFLRRVLPRLKMDDTPLFINLKARGMEEMERMIRQLGTAEHVTGFELNLNCPYGQPAAAHYWRDPQKLSELIARARAACGEKLLVVKSPTAEYLPSSLIPIIEEAGADMFTSFNGITGYAIDIRTRTFRCGMGGGGGYSGPGIKPVALMCAHESYKAGNLPVIGGGGITNAADVIEYILAGAYAVQIGSANLRTPDFMLTLLDDLRSLMEELGISSLDEIRGAAKYF